MEAALRILIVAEWILIIASVASGAALKRRLPPKLQEWLSSDEARESTATGVMYVLILAGTLAGTVGLFLLRPWGFWIYTITTLAASLPGPLPQVEHPVADALDQMSLVLAGAIIAVAYLTVVSPP